MTLTLPSLRGRRTGVAPRPQARASVRLVDGLAGVLATRTTRRGFLQRTAVVGSALAVAPAQYVLRPGTAYAAVCGPDASCSSGYTAFCCTVNGGYNRCPPGNFVGGWWKADGSGFCCGRPRYYVDCHEPCTRCTSGCSTGSFCRGCTECSCRCSGSTGCDQRKTCCNYFRYGQCRQDIACSGPVTCRVVSCTPPWQQYDCSTASATDNRTRDHSADCLPGPCAGDIAEHHSVLGGAGGILGRPLHGERATPDGVGRYVAYERGSIYWTSGTGAWAVWGAIRDRYRTLRWEASPLGYPTSDEQATSDGRGRVGRFQRGSIVWSPAHGAVEVYGDIHARWRALGAERSVLGHPVAGEAAAPRGGRVSRFERGAVLWTSATGARAVYGAILGQYEVLGGPEGFLGYPVGDEEAASTGRVSRFESGRVYWSAATGAHEVHGTILVRYLAEEGPGGALGFPVGDEEDAPGGKVSRFRRGRIVWAAATNTTRVEPA